MVSDPAIPVVQAAVRQTDHALESLNYWYELRDEVIFYTLDVESWWIRRCVSEVAKVSVARGKCSAVRSPRSERVAVRG
jgi:hypothetical protein